MILISKNKSDKSHACLDSKIVLKRAKKIVKILDTFIDLKNCSVLDIGTGSGEIASFIAKRTKKLVSVDLNDERIARSGYEYIKVNSEVLPFKKNSFDIVISNHVVEHVLDQKLHFKEAERVLKKGGLFYVATPNKYWIMEPHYNLPFLSWFPLRISKFYLKKIKNKNFDILPLSYSKLFDLSKNSFYITDMVPKVVKDPEKYALEVYPSIQPIIKIIPAFF